MLYYAAAVLAASMVLGQAEAQDQTDDFEKLRGFLGTWEAPAVEEGGKTLRSCTLWKPILQGYFIEHRFMRLAADNSVSYWGMVIFGRDPSSGKVRGWGFNPRGGLMAMELVKWEGNKSHWSTSGVGPNGEQWRVAANSFEVVDTNKYAWAIESEDGNRMDATYTRIAQDAVAWPELTTEVPEGVSEPMKELAWWVGQCTTEGTDAFTGKLSVGQSRSAWVVNGNFLLYDIANVDSDLNVGQYRAVIGVDPLTNKVTGWEFDSTGAVGKYIVADKGQEIVGEATSRSAGLLKYKGRMTKTADGMEYRATGELPAGKTTSYYGIWKQRK